MVRVLLIGILALTFSGASSRAQGLFDALDPCIAAKNDYWQGRAAIMATLDQEAAAVSSQNAPQEFRDFWWTEKKKLLRNYFDKNLGDVIKASGGNPDKAFEIWLAIQVEKQGGMKAINPIIDGEFRKTKILMLERKKGLTQESLDKTKNNLYSGCPADVGNQVFRGAVTVLTAPINIVSGNFDAAGREPGEVAKLLRIITGVSVRDIQEYGVCGGSNSEMRKLFGSIC